MGKHFEKDHWKPLLFCNGKYQVSRFGKVKSVYNLSKYGVVKMTGNILKTYINSRGYEKVKLSWPESGKRIRKSMAIHRLVAIAFIPNTGNKPQVNHKDLNPLNNDCRNLEWATAKENTIHCHINGAKKYKHKADFIEKIRTDIKSNGVQITADKIGLTYQQVYNIATKKKAYYGFETGALGLPRKYKNVIDTSTGVIYTTKEASDLVSKPLKWLHRRLNGERPNDTIYKYI